MVGLGGVGQRHVRNLRSILGDNVEIIAYRVRKLQHALTDQLAIEPSADIEKKYDIKAFDNLEEALAEKPTMAFICNPTSLHIDAALAAAKAGCHLFIEKPISHTYEHIDELISVVEDKDLAAFVGYQLRFHPCLQRLKSLLDVNPIGNILSIKIEVGEYLPGWHQYEDYRDMYASKASLGGGVVLTQIHELDYAYWLFGPPSRVYALGGRFSELEIDVEDTASILMECAVGGRDIPVHIHQDYLQRPPSRTCKVIGDRGKILLDFQVPSVIVYGDNGKILEQQEFPDFKRNQLFLDELEHFIQCVQGKSTPLVSLRDGAQSLRAGLAVKESINTGRVIDLR